jgi:toxin ParE1/3/4
MSYKISVKASKDIEDIWLYTFKNWSLEQADRYVNLIFDEIEYLAANPNSGKDYNPIRKNYRCSKIKSHLIFYRPGTIRNEIEVIRVLHERMDIENHLNK